MTATNELLFKTLIVGDPAVGKTSIVKRTVHGKYESHYKATIGTDFALKVIQESGYTLRLQIWDIAGNQRVQEAMTRTYYKDSIGAFAVCDTESLTRNMGDTILSVEKWIDDIRAKVKIKVSDEKEMDIPITLLVNKSDLRDLTETETSAIKEFVNTKNLQGYFLTSALNNTGIDEAMKALAQKMLKIQPNLPKPAQQVALDSAPVNAPKSSGCAC